MFIKLASELWHASILFKMPFDETASRTETSWYTLHGESVHISVWAKPNAKQNANRGIKNNALQLALRSRACEGAANKMLLCFMAELLAVAPSRLTLLKGHQSRQKIMRAPLSPSVQQFIDRCVKSS